MERRRQLEYDFVIAPQADPKAIRLSFTGTEKLEVDGQGDLALRVMAKNCGCASQSYIKRGTALERRLAAAIR